MFQLACTTLPPYVAVCSIGQRRGVMSALSSLDHAYQKCPWVFLVVVAAAAATVAVVNRNDE